MTGAALASHPGLKRMSFTGSPEVGRLIAESCGRNLVPVKLELGGKGAAVVFDDAPIAQTARKLAQAITFHSGQVCCDATRWLIHRPIYDQFVSACVERLQRVRIGHQMDAATEMGPVVSEKQQRRILGYLERGRAEGAEAVLPGGAAEVAGRDGFYVKPALLAGSLENVAAREEISALSRISRRSTTKRKPSGWSTGRTTAWPTACGPPTWTEPAAWLRRWWPGTVGSTPTTSFRMVSRTGESTRAVSAEASSAPRPSSTTGEAFLSFARCKE